MRKLAAVGSDSCSNRGRPGEKQSKRNETSDGKPKDPSPEASLSEDPCPNQRCGCVSINGIPAAVNSTLQQLLEHFAGEFLE